MYTRVTARWLAAGEVGHRDHRLPAAPPPESEAKMLIHYAIVYVNDMPRALAFYRDTLGLPQRFESPGWSELAAGPVTLALHSAERDDAPAERGHLRAGRATIGLRVPDLDAFHKAISAKGVPCIQEPRAVFGTRVAQYADPDGLVFSVGEDPREQSGPRQPPRVSAASS